MNKLEEQRIKTARGGGGQTRKVAARIPVRERVLVWPSAALGAGWE
jgi:hypothetical protein